MRYLLYLLICFTYSGYAQSNFWKIEKGGKTKGYILGTIHLADAQLEGVYSSVEKGLGKADVLAMELDLSVINPAELLGLIRSDSVSLKALIGEQFGEVSEKFKAITGMELGMFENHYPFFVVGYLYKAMGKQNTGEPMDLRIMKMAEGKTVVGLETLTEQLAVVKGVPLEYQTDILVQSVVNFEEHKKDHQKMMDLYLKGEMDALRELSLDPVLPEEIKWSFLENRDEKMVGKISGMLAKKKKIFVAVGAGHLGGEKGILKGLTKQGFSVTPVSNE